MMTESDIRKLLAKAEPFRLTVELYEPRTADQGHLPQVPQQHEHREVTAL